MQFLGPALNGTNAYGCRPLAFSGKNRSGSNSSGLGNTFGSRCKSNICTFNIDPAGAVCLPKI